LKRNCVCAGAQLFGDEEMNKLWEPKRGADYFIRLMRAVHRHDARVTLWKTVIVAIILFVALAVDAQTPSKTGAAGPTIQPKSSASKAVNSYYCPMHPDVKSAKRGKCPKCGMALRLARVDTSSTASVDSNVGANNETAGVATAANLSGAADSSGANRKVVVPDVEVLDQDGNRLHFYSDLIKGKTVAINFIFTTCTTICPPLAATFARVQKEMGDRVGRDVHFISISVDPVTDTPERLKAWGAKFKAGAGWTFVTGDKQEIDKLLNALGASVARREDHSPTVIVGNDSKDVWTRTYGLASTSQMMGLILKVIEGKTD